MVECLEDLAVEMLSVGVVIQFTECGTMQEVTSSLVLGDFGHFHSIFADHFVIRLEVSKHIISSSTLKEQTCQSYLRQRIPRMPLTEYRNKVLHPSYLLPGDLDEIQ